MAMIHGKASYFMLNAKDITAYLTGVKFSNSTDVAETSTMGSEVKSYVTGLSDGTLSLDGNYDSTATTGPDAVLDPLIGSDAVTAWIFGPEGSTAGKEKYNGNGFVTKYEVSTSVGDVVKFSADIQITGAVTKGVFP